MTTAMTMSRPLNTYSSKCSFNHFSIFNTFTSGLVSKASHLRNRSSHSPGASFLHQMFRHAIRHYFPLGFLPPVHLPEASASCRMNSRNNAERRSLFHRLAAGTEIYTTSQTMLPVPILAFLILLVTSTLQSLMILIYNILAISEFIPCNITFLSCGNSCHLVDIFHIYISDPEFRVKGQSGDVNSKESLKKLRQIILRP